MTKLDISMFSLIRVLKHLSISRGVSRKSTVQICDHYNVSIAKDFVTLKTV